MKVLSIVLFLLPLVWCYKFPEGFKFGAATASYQIEGGWNASGKGENIWDRFTHTRPDMMANASTGDVACDSYNNWKEDIQMAKYLGLDFYRFSLSWSRILPRGTVDYINPDGVRYYNNLIDGLLAVGIQPMITLYHWDLPQPLQDLGGWANPITADYFVEYANFTFNLFGDRVKTWITFNEPTPFCVGGYSIGLFAPGHKYSGQAEYLCSKTVLVAHAKTYRLYQNEYAADQKGKIGITLSVNWYIPASNHSLDIEATIRQFVFGFDWFANPIFSKSGNYHQIMIDVVARNSKEEGYVRSRLPVLSEEDIELIRGSADFMGLNHYTSHYCKYEKHDKNEKSSREKDVSGKLFKDPKWETSASSWLTVNPEGFRSILNFIKESYDNPLVYVTENGISDFGGLQDDRRINYFDKYLTKLLEAIYEDGCNVQAYTAWSLMDNLEWNSGYNVRFGLFEVDFESPERTRTPKQSAKYYKEVTSSKTVPDAKTFLEKVHH